MRSRQDWVPVSRMWALALRLEPALLALGDLHSGAMRALRGVIRWRLLVLLTAAVVSGGAGLLLGPGWAVAGVASGPLAVCRRGGVHPYRHAPASPAVGDMSCPDTSTKASAVVRVVTLRRG